MKGARCARCKVQVQGGMCQPMQVVDKRDPTTNSVQLGGPQSCSPQFSGQFPDSSGAGGPGRLFSTRAGVDVNIKYTDLP